MDHIKEHQDRMRKQIGATFSVNTPITDDQIQKSDIDELEKGGRAPAAPVGTIKAMGGRNYIKASDGTWKYHGKGGGAKAQEHATGAGHASYGVAEGHMIATDKGAIGKVAKRDETHTYIEHKQEDGKAKISKVKNEDVDNNIAADKWQHHIPASQAKEKAQQTVAASTGTSAPTKQLNESEKMAQDKTADIGKRFKAFEMFTKQVITGKSKSMIAYGSGGVGKTYTVTKQLEEAGKKPFDEDKMQPGDDDYDYVKITGKATPTAVYKALFEHNNKIIVFDDCDSALENDDSVNLFKGALDTSGDGTIAYGSAKKIKDDNGDDLPQRFKFNGRVIFISNLPPDKMPQPLKSRGLKVDLTMDKQQTVDRIKEIATDKSGKLQNLKFPGIDKYTHEEMGDVIKYLDKNKDHIGDLNVRTVGKMLGILQTADEMGEKKDWESYADQELFSKSDSMSPGWFQKAAMFNLYKGEKGNYTKSEEIGSKDYVVKGEQSEQLIKGETDELGGAFNELFMKGGPGSGRHKGSGNSSIKRRDPSIFKDEGDVYDNHFIPIKAQVMKEMGIDDDDDDYEREEDSIMREACERFKEKYGWDHPVDAVADLKKYKNNK